MSIDVNPQSTVAIIGGGYCGTMVAVHLLGQKNIPLHLVVVNSGYPLSKGVAYSSYSHRHLLNVAAKNMSAFAGKPTHFVEWIKKHESYGAIDRNTLPEMFLPRNIYGNYLKDIFDTAIRNKPENISISFVHDEAIDIEIKNNKSHIYFSVSPEVVAEKIVLATGNQSPANPKLEDETFYSSQNYFPNPWLHESVNHLPSDKEVLILGNGLTMVDVVLGLREKNHAGKIHSLSPTGFQILPHRPFEPYKGLTEELKPPYDLKTVVNLFRKHVNKLREQGVTGEAAVDSLRPFTQQVWQSLSKPEKERFMYHLRHMWGVARHRLPMNIHQKIQNLILDDKLEIIAGQLISLEETRNGIAAEIRRKKNGDAYKLNVGRVINCTVPFSDINKIQRPLIRNLVSRKLIHADEMRLGIYATADGYVLNEDGSESNFLYTLGNNLRGVLWESTAVPELREQAKNLAENLLKEISS